MSDDNELKLKIAQLSGRINRKEQEVSTSASSNTPGDTGGYPRPHGVRGASTWRPPRGSSYGRGRGIQKRMSAPVHRNRTLVLNNVGNGALAGQEQATSVDDASDEAKHDVSENGRRDSTVLWIAKHDRHKQLINPAVYERETQNRIRAMEETRKRKAMERERRERAKVNRHLQRYSKEVALPSLPTDNQAPSRPMYEITIQGIRFQVTNGGSRLLKIPDDFNSTKRTPKRTTVGGVTFMRSKTGNLYRAGVVKASKRSGIVKKIDELCKRFTTTGTIQFAPVFVPSPHHSTTQPFRPSGSCPKGPLCPYIHDAGKVAICKTFLQTGKCPAGDSCDLSHDSTPERVPACLHFLKGNCSNSNCRYAHVRVSPGAPVCRPFAVLGYCGDGAECNNRHVHECPDYANTGACHDEKCRLPHVDRAGQIRKTTANASASLRKAKGADATTDNDDSDLSSDEEDQNEVDSDDVDSDGLAEEFMDISEDPANPALVQQQDFIHF